MSSEQLLSRMSSDEDSNEEYQRYRKSEDEEASYVAHHSPAHHPRRKLLAALLVSGLASAALCGHYIPILTSKLFNYPSSSTCANPGIRYEWRSLSHEEQTQYLDAVDCLRTKPSKLGMNHTLYDDFPYIHFQKGAYSHRAAPFLSWHRYFIHAYEQTLRQECEYTGHLTYWDWTLDWTNLTAAPIWSPDTFGTTGDPASPDDTEIMKGHCVVDGRFAHLRIPLFRDQQLPHCLARGFTTNATDLLDKGSRLRPSEIQRMLAMDGFAEFFRALEDGAHDTIPHTVRGDFDVFTAPADPVFFLHHSQLDRVWKMWQDRDPAKRQRQYAGPAAHKSDKEASLDDVLSLGGFLEDVQVRDILNAENEKLCYQYS